MTYQEYEPKALMADFILTVQNGVVVGHVKVPWLNEETADIVILFKLPRGSYRWAGIKIIGNSSPWGAYHAVEQWAAQFDDVVELHMIHSSVYKFGEF